KEGNTYTVLTAAHVLEDNNNREYTIVTGDEKKHPIDRKSIKLQEGVDLAVVKFQSRENYPIATLADYPATDRQYTYTAGYPQIGDKSPWRFTLGWTYSKERGLLLSTESDFKTIASGLQSSVAAFSLTGGYELVYTNITLGGMSGGPVLDAQGRVIGIHGRAEGQVAIDEKTGDKGGNRGSQVQLGFSLGVPTSTFLAISSRLNTQAQQVEKTAARELEPKEIESIKQAILSVDVSQGNATASQWIERGNQLWRLGRYTEAVTAFDNAIKQKPAFIHLAYYGKGLSLADNSKYKDAVMALKQSVSAKPDFVPGWSKLSIASTELGNLEDAEKAINEAIRLEPKNPNLYNRKGFVLSYLKRYREAIDAINEVIRINPNFAYAYNNRGNARYDLGDKQGAIGDFNQAIQINPNYAYAYYNRGSARYDLGDKQGAIVDYNQAIQIHPNYANAYNNRGNARSELGDKQGAIVDYTQAIQINPNYANAYYNRGNARYHLGDKQGAIVDYNQAIQINPNDAIAYYNRGLARYHLGDKQGAISDLQTAAQLFQQQGNQESYQRTLNIISQLR
ncbi:MAG: tetratricopeptide repeat-containing serine protease family protein, partial [Cylindrospermopsis raciborskii 1523720]|uniref:tetratricopeptide repeat-containing serine protease family protein n=1 Tax=Cylindrospermopsis raciborskii TaxID=77022 RepID=UPI002B470B61